MTTCPLCQRGSLRIITTITREEVITKSFRQGQHSTAPPSRGSRSCPPRRLWQGGLSPLVHLSLPWRGPRSPLAHPLARDPVGGGRWHQGVYRPYPPALHSLRQSSFRSRQRQEVEGLATGKSIRAVTPAFEELFSSITLYRATGVILLKLTEASYGQLDLFGQAMRMQQLSNLYESGDTLRDKYGKHTVFLGASFLAHTHVQHDGKRGHLLEL